MERVSMFKNSKKYGFNKGDNFTVLRNINYECVIIMKDKPNVVIPENVLKRYGKLSGDAEINF